MFHVDNKTISCFDSSQIYWSMSRIVILNSLLFINVVVISANLLVVCVIAFNKHLRATNSNLFILSLAVSDLTLGLFVLPISTANQTVGSWFFGSTVCRIWLALDVWLCTASIYNLVVITIDRFIAVTKPLAYKAIITTRKVMYMILAAWMCSFCLSIPVFFLRRPELDQCRCTHMTNNRMFVLLSSAISFYVPFFFILYFYFRIYSRIRVVTSSTNQGFIKLSNSYTSAEFGSLQISKSKSSENTPLRNQSKETIGVSCNNLQDCLRIHRGGYCAKEKIPLTPPHKTGSDQFDLNPVNRSTEECLLSVASSRYSPLPRPRSQTWEGNTSHKINRNGHCFPKTFGVTLTLVPEVNGSMNLNTPPNHLQPRSLSSLLTKRYESSIVKYQKRLSIELKTLKTVGIITGCVLISWVGFCLIYALESLQIYRFPETTVIIFMWLGYVNSAVNPFIYAGYNRQYRESLKTLFKCGENSDTYDTPSFFSGVTQNGSSRKGS